MRTLPDASWRWVRLLWLLAGGAFTVSHVVRDGPDTTAIAGLLFTFAVFVLPSITGLKLPGGAELQLQPQAVAQLSSATVELSDDVAALLGAFTASILATDAVLTRDGDAVAKAAYARLRCAKVIDDSLRWFAVDEPVRVTVYRYRAAASGQPAGLYFEMGNVAADEAAVLERGYFPPAGDDPIPTAWRRLRTVNVAEAAPDDRPQTVAAYGVTYHGIMAVPLRRVDEPWGVLLVERRQPLPFDVLGERVADGLGNVITAALTHPVLVAA